MVEAVAMTGLFLALILVGTHIFIALGVAGTLGLTYAARLVSPFGGGSAEKSAGPAPEVGQQL